MDQREVNQNESDALGCSCGAVGCSWGALGFSGVFLRRFGDALGVLSGVLPDPLASSMPFGILLGPHWGPLGNLLEPHESLLGGAWGDMGKHMICCHAL